jgi:hypothetical protein
VAVTSDWTDLDIQILSGGRPLPVAGPLPGHPEWKITATFVRQGDQLVVSSCTIAPAAEGVPAGGLTARQLRRVTLGGLTRLVRRGAVGRIMMGMAPEAIAWTVDDDQANPRPGRAGRDDHFYAVWAARYAEQVAYSARPIADLAAAHGRPPARLRQYIAEARRRGLLSPTTPGRSGGQLTDKAQALLQSSQDT